MLTVMRRGALCSRPSVRSACGQLFLARSTAICIYIWLLAVEATAERSARVPPRALYQRLGVRTITSGPHMHAVAPHALPCDAVTCGTMELRAAK